MEWIRIHVKGKSRGRVAIEVRSEKGDTRAEEACRAEPRVAALARGRSRFCLPRRIMAANVICRLWEAASGDTRPLWVATLSGANLNRPSPWIILLEGVNFGGYTSGNISFGSA
jgi:hypothetical protein